jgi:hypothetical protein
LTGQPDEGPIPWWDPVGVWQNAAQSFTDLAADQVLPVAGPRNALQALVDGLRAGLVGRPVAVGKGARRLAFTLSSLEASVSHMAAAAGQADDVSLSAENVEFRSYQFVSVSGRLSNVHTRMRAVPLLVSAPIDLSLTMTSEQLSAWLANLVPNVTVEINDAGRLFVRRAGRPYWGYVEVRPAVEKGSLVLRPTAVGRGERLWRFRRQLVPARPNVPLSDWVRITGVDLHPHRLEVHLRVDEWRLDYRDLVSLVRKPQ